MALHWNKSEVDCFYGCEGVMEIGVEGHECFGWHVFDGELWHDVFIDPQEGWVMLRTDKTKFTRTHPTFEVAFHCGDISWTDGREYQCVGIHSTLRFFRSDDTSRQDVIVYLTRMADGHISFAPTVRGDPNRELETRAT